MIVVVLSPELLDLAVDALPDLKASSRATLSRGPGPDMTATFSSAILRLVAQVGLGLRGLKLVKAVKIDGYLVIGRPAVGCSGGFEGSSECGGGLSSLSLGSRDSRFRV
jgi:hypothetical protein